MPQETATEEYGVDYVTWCGTLYVTQRATATEDPRNTHGTPTVAITSCLVLHGESNKRQMLGVVATERTIYHATCLGMGDAS